MSVLVSTLIKFLSWYVPSPNNSSGISFVKEGQKPKNVRKPKVGLLHSAPKWKILYDFQGSPTVPSFLTVTTLRPDIVLYSCSIKAVIIIELTCPCEENMPYWHDKKRENYHSLCTSIKANGWRVFFFAVEVGARGYAAESLLSCLKKTTTNMRDPISPSERLTVTLRYLVAGDVQVTIAASYRMSPMTVGRIIKETCQVIWEEMLSNDYLAVPSTINAWKTIGLDFEKRWNFPNVLGAIDGKHVVIQAPSRSGSAFFNYKKTFSIILMAVCDSKYRFIVVDIGDTGRQSDGSVYANSFLGNAIQLNILKLPTDGNMPIGSQRNLPYVFIGDDAFALKTNMMKPYPFQNHLLDEKIFNYHLSSARRTIENTFGIAAIRFRIFYRPIKAEVKTVVFITKAVIIIYSTAPQTLQTKKVRTATFQENGGEKTVQVWKIFAELDQIIILLMLE